MTERMSNVTIKSGGETNKIMHIAQTRRKILKKKEKQWLSIALSAAMVVTGIPATGIGTTVQAASGEAQVSVKNGEVTIGNEYLERKFSTSDNKLATTELENKRADLTFTPAQGSEEFIIKLRQDGTTKLDGGNSAKSVLVAATGANASANASVPNKKISLKIMTLNNNRQKINDCLGNPVEIGIAVMWRVTDTAKAVFHVDNYKEYLSLQCDSALRNIVRIYPYDVAPNVDTTGDGIADEGSLRGSSEIVAGRIRDEIQKKVAEAGLEIIEARITYLAYAPEIAAVMLQRQQASAIIDARKMIVDGAVGMVEMALERLNENQVVELDEERKAAMVSNLLVVLCGNHDAQPVVNSGSLY